MSDRRAATSRRPATADDRDFLYELIRRSLGPHVEATYGAWDDGWQRQHFQETTDPATHEIVERDGCSIGCLCVEEGESELELQRILLLPEHQNQGIGAALMRSVLDAAARSGKSVRLQVFRVSPAIRFYERLGFRRIAETATHVVMRSV